MTSGYGLWFLVVFNSLPFILFAASFFHPHSKRDWRQHQSSILRRGAY